MKPAPVILFLCIFLLPATAQPKMDEQVVFFPTAAWKEDGRWRGPIHGWIFEEETDSLTRTALLKALRKALANQLDGSNQDLFQERTRWFLVDNERGKKLRIALNGERFKTGRSQKNGHFTREISFNAPQGADSLRYTAVVKDRDKRVFAGAVHLVEDGGLGVISDVDDTIKISEVLDKKALLAHTFCKPFQATQGFPQFYGELAAQGASFFYVSASPWQLYPPLKAFMEEVGYPPGPVYLRKLRVKDASFYRFLFHESRQFKEQTITGLFKRYPNKRFILIGDAGENDPEIYASTAKRFPERVAKIIIRRVGHHEKDGRLKEMVQDLAPIPMEIR